MLPITVALLVIAVALVVYYLFSRGTDYFQENGIPYVRPWPVVGNLGPSVFYRRALQELLEEYYYMEPNAKYVGFYSMNKPVLIVKDPELIKLIGVKQFENFPNHQTMGLSNKQEPLFAKNLTALQGQRWKEVRSLLSPSFTTLKIKGMFKLMVECASNFAEFLAQESPEKREMDTKNIFTRYTTDVIATCAFGVKVDSMRNPKNDFYVYGTKATSFGTAAFIKFTILAFCPKLYNLLKLKLVSPDISKFFSETFKEIIDTRDKNGITRPDILQVMLDSRGKTEDREGLSIEDMVSQAFVFFLAGFDTSANLMCFAAHEIAANPDVQEKIQREIDDVLETTSGDVTYEAVNSMKYLEAVIDETLRKFPIAFITDRVCEKTVALPPALPGQKEIVVKEGMDIWFPIFNLQRDPMYYEDPEKFDPDRFLNENKNTWNSSVYMPFGIGPRMCIGNRFALLEVKVLFFFLLAWCNLKPSPKMTIPFQFSRSKPMYPKDGFWLKVERCK